MATINAGRVRPYYRGAWSNSVKYNFFDLVTNGGSSYLCINTSGAPAGTALSSTSYWALIAQKGDTGAKGATGATGSAGTAATITIGTVTTGAAGTNAVVTNVGTATAAKLNFTIPRGATGETGPQGPSGVYTGPLKPTSDYWRSAEYTNNTIKLPSGGTWAYIGQSTTTVSSGANSTASLATLSKGIAAGGTTLKTLTGNAMGQGAKYSLQYLCWRIA